MMYVYTSRYSVRTFARCSGVGNIDWESARGHLVLHDIKERMSLVLQRDGRLDVARSDKRGQCVIYVGFNKNSNQ